MIVCSRNEALKPPAYPPSRPRYGRLVGGHRIGTLIECDLTVGSTRHWAGGPTGRPLICQAGGWLWRGWWCCCWCWCYCNRLAEAAAGYIGSATLWSSAVGAERRYGARACVSLLRLPLLPVHSLALFNSTLPLFLWLKKIHLVINIFKFLFLEFTEWEPITLINLIEIPCSPILRDVSPIGGFKASFREQTIVPGGKTTFWAS